MKNKVIDVVAAAIWDGVDSLLIGQRASWDTFPGVWEFVGGKVEDGEDFLAALQREIQEELGIAIEVLEPLGEHEFSNGPIQFRLHVFFARWMSGVPQAFEHEALEWIKTVQLRDRNWSEPDRPFLERVAQTLKKRI